ncbi:hemolysin family protein [Adlercreutzia sp. ZJ138]|uniref:hemolysin family protein n=1 Tax=Adlercreutzia sp. ZJ138 TaxID=2709405 RepID=UPI0013EE3220|nr:hemolysin family protein [Adlercreutzia sp. ZJ138]
MEKGKKQGRGMFELFNRKNQSLSEEEIKSMVEGNDELLADEKRMISDILDLRDMAVREIMIPRVDMILVEDVETIRQALDRMRGTGYSRLPVYHEDCDNITGIIHFKDLIAPLMDGRCDDTVADYAYEAMFVPESKDVFPLLAEMQTKRQQMAIVVDEYGGTDGLITVEDIVEEIVGEIADETDHESTLISVVSDGAWLADGRCTVEEAIERGWPLEDSDDYETLAGWLMSKLDTVPETGDQLDFQGYRFRIVAMRRLRISKVRIERLPDLGTSDAAKA